MFSCWKKILKTIVFFFCLKKNLKKIVFFLFEKNHPWRVGGPDRFISTLPYSRSAHGGATLPNFPFFPPFYPPTLFFLPNFASFFFFFDQKFFQNKPTILKHPSKYFLSNPLELVLDIFISDRSTPVCTRALTVCGTVLVGKRQWR